MDWNVVKHLIMSALSDLTGVELRYQKAYYGPYAINLSHVLKAIEGHLISGYADGGDNPEKRIELVPGAIGEAGNFLSVRPATQERIDRVSDLVAGFETSFGLELLSTVHWVAKESVLDRVDLGE